MFYLIKNGFTLFEMVVSLSILAICASLAIPQFQNHFARQEAEFSRVHLENAVRLARQSALLYHTNIVICPSQDQKNCLNNHWNDGFIVFSDINKNRQMDGNDTLIDAHVLALKYGALQWKGTLNFPNLNFQSDDGLPIGSNGSFYYCSERQFNYRLVMSKMSHLRVDSQYRC